MSKNNKKEKKGIKAKIKTELGYMKKGAKILPRVVAKKGKLWMKQQMAAAKERAKAEREIEKAAKEAEREAYKIEAIRQAKLRGRAKAKKGRAGWRGALTQVGEVGERISLSGVLGVETGKKREKVVRKSEIEGLSGMSSSDYLFSGLGQKKKKKE